MTKKTEDKKRKEETREDKIERERTELLAKLTHSSLSDIRSRVGFILNHYPGTRNDDVALSIQYWKIFNTDLLSGNVVNLGDLYRLTRITSIIRARAKIQNTFGLFMADEETRKKRAQLDEEQRQIQVEDMPDIPLISIYCDESG